MKYIITAAILVFAFAECKDDEEVIVEHEIKPQIWEEIKHFSGRSKILLNSLATNDKLIIYGHDAVTQVFDIKENGDLSYETYSFDPFDTFYKPTMNSNFMSTAIYDIKINLTAILGDWASTLPHYIFDLKRFDSSILHIHKLNHFEGEFIPANSAKQLLIPIRAYNSLRSEFILASVRMPFNHFIEGVDLKYLAIPDPHFHWLYLNSMDDVFFAANTEATHRISSDGTINEISNFGLKTIAKYDPDINVTGDEFYLGFNRQGHAAISRDKGFTWDAFNNLSFPWIDVYHFTNINGEILGYYNNSIIHLILKDNSLEIKQVDIQGLEGHYITSLSKFKNDIFVTTFSGCFKKQASKFFTYRD